MPDLQVTLENVEFNLIFLNSQVFSSNKISIVSYM